MKKALLVLLMAASICTFTVFAAEVNFSGEFEYGFMTDGESFSGEFDKIELDIEGVIDEYNTFSMEIEDADTTNTLDSDLPLSISWADVTTDWGALLSLPIGVSTSVGYNGYGIGDSVGASGWGLECYGGLWNDSEGGVELDLTFAEMVTVTAAYNTDFVTDDTLDLIVGASATVEDLVLTLGYGLAGGDLTAEAQYSLGLPSEMALDMAGSFYYDTADAVAGSELFYGLGLGYSVAGATLGVSFNGNDADALNNLGVDVDYAITDTLCVDVATLFDMTSDATDTWLGVDLSATYTAGAVSYTLGYLTDADAQYASETALDDGGVYFGVALDF